MTWCSRVYFSILHSVFIISNGFGDQIFCTLVVSTNEPRVDILRGSAHEYPSGFSVSRNSVLEDEELSDFGT